MREANACPRGVDEQRPEAHPPRREPRRGRGVETKEANVTSPDPVDYFINAVQEVEP